jgi:hypothetical protein
MPLYLVLKDGSILLNDAGAMVLSPSDPPDPSCCCGGGTGCVSACRDYVDVVLPALSNLGPTTCCPAWGSQTIRLNFASSTLDGSILCCTYEWINTGEDDCYLTDITATVCIDSASNTIDITILVSAYDAAQTPTNIVAVYFVAEDLPCDGSTSYSVPWSVTGFCEPDGDATIIFGPVT